ncbi:MAG: hypothetical protein Q8P48_02695, partial [Deltaproteobacteria bacterium]|nr:hypothetical protein [Deltaproteobacteria bacterium]
AASKEDLRVMDAFKGAAKTFLGIDAEPAGVLYLRPSVKAAARKMRPFMLDEGAVEAHADMESIVSNLLAAPAGLRAPAPGDEAEAPAPVEAASGSAKQEVFGFNDNVPHQGTVFHVQTEVHGGGEPFIETIIYNGGRIFFSKRTAWRDVSGNGSIRDFAQRQHRAAMAAVKMDKISLQG